MRAQGGMTAEELAKKNEKDAKDRSGNDQDVASEKADALRDREKLQKVVFVRERRQGAACRRSRPASPTIP